MRNMQNCNSVAKFYMSLHPLWRELWTYHRQRSSHCFILRCPHIAHIADYHDGTWQTSTEKKIMLNRHCQEIFSAHILKISNNVPTSLFRRTVLISNSSQILQKILISEWLSDDRVPVVLRQSPSCIVCQPQNFSHTAEILTCRCQRGLPLSSTCLIYVLVTGYPSWIQKMSTTFIFHRQNPTVFSIPNIVSRQLFNSLVSWPYRSVLFRGVISANMSVQNILSLLFAL